MVPPPRPYRESITLSSRCAQKGHFTRHDLLVDGQLRPALLSYAPVRATSPTTVLPESRTAHPRDCKRSEEHTSELQSRLHLVCRLLLEKKKKQKSYMVTTQTLELV